MVVEIGGHWTDCDFMPVYRESESSFAIEPQSNEGVSSALVNDLQLEVDDDGIVLYAWGLFPHPSTWHPTVFNPPIASRRRMRIVVSDGWTPGVSRRLNANRWDAFMNATTGWVCLGDPEASQDVVAVEFAPNSVAVVEKEAVVAIWLRPKTIPKANS